MYGVVYKATSIINGKEYVGQTKNNLLKRIKEHLRPNKKRVSLLSRAIKKYGTENFKWVTIDIAYSREDLDNKEIFWIKFFNTIAPNGYNLTHGGSSYIFTDEVKKRISIKTKEAMCRPEVREKFLWTNSRKEGYTSPKKGKTHDKIYGEEKANRISEKISNTLRTYFSNTKNTEKLSNTVKEYFKSEENREKTRKATKEAMRSPEVRLKCSLGAKGKVRVNNGIVSKLIKKDDLDYYLSNGWMKGFIKKDYLEEDRVRLGNGIRNKIKVNNGTVNMFIKRDELDNYLNNGWFKGPIGVYGKIYVNDGHTSKLIEKCELSTYLDKGWVKGRRGNKRKEVSTNE